jgi:hypothetical protein
MPDMKISEEALLTAQTLNAASLANLETIKSAVMAEQQIAIAAVANAQNFAAVTRLLIAVLEMANAEAS